MRHKRQIRQKCAWRYDGRMDFSSPAAWAFWVLTGIAAYLGAYATEKGKRRAAREDSAQIRDELTKTTRTLKEIEASISNELWERQWRLNQKRDIYARLLESMSELELSVSVLSKYFAMQPTEHIAGEVDKHGERATQVGRELERAMAVARVYLPKEAIATFENLESELRKPAPELEYSAVCAALVRTQEGLTSAAKVDLGF